MDAFWDGPNDNDLEKGEYLVIINENIIYKSDPFSISTPWY